MQITLAGLGMGAQDTMTLGAYKALTQADAVLGAKRLLESLPPEIGAPRVNRYRPRDVLDWLRDNGELARICIVFSGDIGFHSGASRLHPALAQAGYAVECVSGVSTVPYLCGRLGIPWQDVRMASAHGEPCDVLAHVLEHERCCFLADHATTPAVICRALCDAGLGDAAVTVGERLSYPDERLESGKAEDFTRRDFSSLSCVLVYRNRPVFRWEARTQGIPDSEFIRGDVPMTKQEVRAVALAKLALREDDTVWDIGAGTGSVSVEMALAARRGRVYAIEQNPGGCALIRQNREKFGVYNLTGIHGAAPEACGELPAPDAAFLGGTGGCLRECLALLLRKNPAVRVVVAAVTVETISAVMPSLRESGFTGIEAVQVSVSRAERTGESLLLRAQNPVFLFSGRGPGA